MTYPHDSSGYGNQPGGKGIDSSATQQPQYQSVSYEDHASNYAVDYSDYAGPGYSNEAYGARGYGSLPQPQYMQEQALESEQRTVQPDQLGFFSYRSESTEGPGSGGISNAPRPKRRGLEVQEEVVKKDSLLKKIFTFCTDGISGIITAVILFTVTTTLFIWPGFLRPRALHPQYTEQQIEALVKKTFGWSDISRVSCDTSHVDIKPGNSFLCVITSDNVKIHITGTFKNSHGDYSISKPVFVH